jgi:hypothetical protein
MGIGSMLRFLRIAAVLLFPCLATAPAEETDRAWLDRVSAARETIGREQDPVAAAQAALFQLSLDFPVRTDWLLQDHPAAAWRLLLPAGSAAAEQALAERHGIDPAPAETRLARWLAACEARREARLRATLDRWAPFAFTEGATFRMSFIGYTEGLSDARHERFFKPGARLTVLDFDKGSTHARPRVLLDDPHGMMRDADVSFDRQRLLFAWKKSDRLDDYHLYEYDLTKQEVRQLTTGLGRADYEPIYLPDGDIVFASTRPEQSVPCWWTEISNLYRMDKNGRFIRRLAIDQVHTLYPQLLGDGRVCYTRWDYSDRGQNYPHPVFSMNPDGKAQRAFYGGNSWFPTSLLHTRGIPGSHKAMSIAAGHHTNQHGKLVVIDVSEGADEGAGMQFIAPRREVPYERVDRAMQHGDQFRYPFPFSEDEFLVSYLPDYGFQPSKGFASSEHYGLYWMNAGGARELLHRAPGLGVLRPVALGHRPAPPVIPDTVDYAKKTGTYYVHDVYRGIGLRGVPRGTAKKIRVVRLNYRAAGVGQTDNHGEGGGSLNSGPVAIGNGTWDIKEILGDADVHEDGSAMFEVPAMESIYLQVLDARGRVIQTTRSWDTVRPGEMKSCMGCHDKGSRSFEGLPERPARAFQHGVQKLEPFYGPTRGFSFPREIQPILDRKCVSCHDGSGKDVSDLTGNPVDGKNLNQREWSRAYINLTGSILEKNGNYRANPEEGLVTWISKMSRPTELPPWFSGSSQSPLLRMLDDGHHKVELSEEEYHKLAAWMDLLVPFCGTYREANAWSAQDMRYYDYFEAKRDAQAREETDEIAAYIARQWDEPRTSAPRAPFTRATYRSLMETTAWQSAGDGTWRLAADHQPALIDRVELPPGFNGGEIRILKDGRDIVRLASRGGENVAVFPHPLRSEELRIRGGSQSPAGIRLIGVPVDELPEHEGYRRHLDYAR